MELEGCRSTCGGAGPAVLPSASGELPPKRYRGNVPEPSRRVQPSSISRSQVSTALANRGNIWNAD